jgi:hypothetical protein
MILGCHWVKLSMLRICKLISLFRAMEKLLYVNEWHTAHISLYSYLGSLGRISLNKQEISASISTMLFSVTFTSSHYCYPSCLHSTYIMCMSQYTHRTACSLIIIKTDDCARYKNWLNKIYPVLFKHMLLYFKTYLYFLSPDIIDYLTI